MTPSYFAFMDHLPSTNGKLDRKALPRPDGKRPALNQVYLEPATNIERELVQIWEDVLGIRPIGTRDNFFDLGGHSLAATRIVSRVLKKFRSDIPLKVLFDAPTVGEMASTISERNWETLDEEGLLIALNEIDSLTDEEAETVSERRDLNKPT
jgi:acyl carrier protein